MARSWRNFFRRSKDEPEDQKPVTEPRQAIEFYEQHLAIAREIGDRRGESAALGNLGLAYAEAWQVTRRYAAWAANGAVPGAAELDAARRAVMRIAHLMVLLPIAGVMLARGILTV